MKLSASLATLFVFASSLLNHVSAKELAKSANTSTPSLTLVKDGQSAYVIALADDAIPAEETAAAELKAYLFKISGADLVIKKESAVDVKQPQILVGAGVRVRKMMPGFKWDSLGSDGIVIKTVGKNLVLAGGRSRGSLYAVYSFLEESLSIRWWTPAESTVPQTRNIRIAPCSISYTPALKTREVFYNSVQRDPLFATRLKINGHHQTQDAKLGGHNSILGFVHTFDQLLPPAKYFKEHPEWYSDAANGGLPCTALSKMPAPQTSQLCLTNEAARRELTKNALEWIRKNPEAGMISISQNDNGNKCTAPADLEIETREASPAGPVLRFVNAVAEDIEKEFPGFLVETLAYQYTRKPPRYARPGKNVVIRLCFSEGDFSRPVDSKANSVFRDDVLGWKQIAPRLYIWNYVTNFTNVLLPHPNLNSLGANIRFFAANNAIALFEQGDAYSGGTGDFVAMRTWVLSHLMWDPRRDQQKLEAEFLRSYYGAAAPYLRAYLDTIQEAFAKTGRPLSTIQTDHSYLTLDVLNAATRQFRGAQTAVKDNAVLARRVLREKLALEHAWLVRFRPLQREARERALVWEGPKDAQEFVRLATEFKVEFYSESEVFEFYGPQLLARFAPSSPLPAFLQGKNDTDVVDGQEGEFSLYRGGELVNIVDDAKASNGRAAKIIGNTDSWAVQFPLNDDGLLKNEQWHCYAMVRVQAKPGVVPGPVMTGGIYDVKNKMQLPAVIRTLEEVGGQEYRAVDLGVYSLHAGMYVWIAPIQRADIEGVFIDRVILVKEPAISH